MVCFSLAASCASGSRARLKLDIYANVYRSYAYVRSFSLSLSLFLTFSSFYSVSSSLTHTLSYTWEFVNNTHTYIHNHTQLHTHTPIFWRTTTDTHPTSDTYTRKKRTLQHTYTHAQIKTHTQTKKSQIRKLQCLSARFRFGYMVQPTVEHKVQSNNSFLCICLRHEDHRFMHLWHVNRTVSAVPNGISHAASQRKRYIHCASTTTLCFHDNNHVSQMACSVGPYRVTASKG